MNRRETLNEAIENVCGDREYEYGSPEDNFKSIAALWSVYKDVIFDASDVAMMMALLKIARIKTGTATEDSFVDLAGYAACGAEIVTNGEKDIADIFTEFANTATTYMKDTIDSCDDCKYKFLYKGMMYCTSPLECIIYPQQTQIVNEKENE